jgi:ketosteroid isomerase-like protein
MVILKSGEDAVTSAVADDFRGRVYGDAAVVIARLTYKMRVEGREISSQERFTDIWVKLAGRWRCVATHSSRIAQK